MFVLQNPLSKTLTISLFEEVLILSLSHVRHSQIFYELAIFKRELFQISLPTAIEMIQQ